MYTGQEIVTITTDSYIENFMLSTVSNVVLVGTYDGKVTYYNALTGDVVNDYIVEFSDSMLDLQTKNGSFISSGFRSPNLTVMKFSEDEDYTSKQELEHPFNGWAQTSPSGKSFTLKTGNSLSDELAYFCIYDTETGEKLGQVEVEKSRAGDFAYVDEDTVMFPTYNGKLVFYSIKDNTENVVAMPTEVLSATFGISYNKEYVVFGVNKEYFVIDAKQQKIVYSGETDVNFWTMAVSNDGKTIYSTNVYNEAYKINAASGKASSIFEKYQVRSIVLNSNDNLAALICYDGHLRIYDLETNKVVNEIEYHGDNYSFVEFSADNQLLYLQGDDLYFRIYDMEGDATVFLMDEQIGDISYTFYDEQSNRLAIFNYYEMYIIDLDSYGLVDRADCGRLYIPRYQTIISARGTEFTTFKIKSQEDLINKVKERFKDAQLTELQRLKYRIN